MNKLTNLLILVFGALVLLFVARSQAGAGHDFLQYWASARLLWQDSNPYSKPLTASVEADAGVGSGERTMVTPNPPYVLPFFLPLAYFHDPKPGGVIWLIVLAACVVVSLRAQWLAYLYPPVFACLLGGQSAPCLLLGVTLFLRYHREKPWAAGLSLLLLAFKPHLFIPFGIALLGWIITRKAYSMLWSAGGGLVILSAIVTALRPQVWSDYLQMGRTNGMRHWFIPCFSGWMRQVVHPSWVWLQFVPLMLGCAWAAYYFRRRQKVWDWRTHGGLLLMVSLAVSPYEWFTDEIAILPILLIGLHAGRSMVMLAILSTIAGLELLTGILPNTGFYTWTILAWIGWWTLRPRALPQPAAQIPHVVSH